VSLHDGALCAASAVLLSFVCMHPFYFGATIRPSSSGATDNVAVVLADFADNVVKGVLDVDAGFGRRLDEFAAKAPGKLFAICVGSC